MAHFSATVYGKIYCKHNQPNYLTKQRRKQEPKSVARAMSILEVLNESLAQNRVSWNQIVDNSSEECNQIRDFFYCETCLMSHLFISRLTRTL